MRILALLTIFIALLFTPLSVQAEAVSFPSADGLAITADLVNANTKTAIVLFHQAGSSRGEYQTIAPRLNKLGYTTLAIDQRSGQRFGSVVNATARQAASLGKGQNFLDARADMEAAIAYAHRLPGIQKVIIWGSSYSSALSLVIAGEKSAKVDGVLSFSPGEYLSPLSVKRAAKTIDVPTFISSARSEVAQWTEIAAAIPATSKVTAFHPEGSGRHGSSALIAQLSANAEEYWQAVELFLKENFKP